MKNIDFETTKILFNDVQPCDDCTSDTRPWLFSMVFREKGAEKKSPKRLAVMHMPGKPDLVFGELAESGPAKYACCVVNEADGFSLVLVAESEKGKTAFQIGAFGCNEVPVCAMLLLGDITGREVLQFYIFEKRKAPASSKLSRKYGLESMEEIKKPLEVLNFVTGKNFLAFLAPYSARALAVDNGEDSIHPENVDGGEVDPAGGTNNVDAKSEN